MGKIVGKVKSAIRQLYMLHKEEKKIPVPVMTDSGKMLEGKIALITGGSGGIGYAIAKQFIESGCKVIITGTNEQKLEKCQEQLGNDCRSLVLNMLEPNTFCDKIKEAAAMYQENRIDILVNSAGQIVNSDFLNMSEEEYDRVMDVNLRGTFFMCQAMGKYMIDHKLKGHILNVSSASALRPAWTPYEISKWGVRGFTKGLADTMLPYGIIVNAIAPGPVATPMLGVQEGDSIYNGVNPSGRYAMPSEIAALAVFMVSDFGNLIVGDTFYMTGGSGTISLHK